MIVLIWPEYNAAGNVVLKPLPDSVLNENSRRVSRRATIDGGVYLDDSGHAHGDKTLRILIKNQQDLEQQLNSLLEGFSLCHLAMGADVYSGVINNITNETENLMINFLVKEKVA